MEAEARTQTAFRLKDTLLLRLKQQARKEKRSLNSLVEESLESVTGLRITYPRLPENFTPSEEALGFAVDCGLDDRYRGQRAAEQAAMDKRILQERLEEKYG